MKCISYNWQHPLILSKFLRDSSNKLTLTIVIHFLSCDLYKHKQNLKNIYLTLYHYFELPRWEPKAIFGSMKGWYLQKRKKKSHCLSSQMYFLAPVRSQEPRIWKLKYLKTGFFKSFKCDFWISHPKNLPIPNFKMKGWLEQ